MLIKWIDSIIVSLVPILYTTQRYNSKRMSLKEILETEMRTYWLFKSSRIAVAPLHICTPKGIGEGQKKSL